MYQAFVLFDPQLDILVNHLETVPLAQMLGVRVAKVVSKDVFCSLLILHFVILFEVQVPRSVGFQILSDGRDHLS